jgi:hypothetical protein
VRVRARGFEPFVRATLLEPDPRFFPDRWEPTRAGVRRLARRLLTYAGLDELDARIEVFGEGDEPRGRGTSTVTHVGTQAWYAGTEGGVCYFGVARHLLAGLGAGGALAHARRRGYMCTNPECEAPLALGDTRCAKCGGRVEGVLQDIDKRLDAVDEVEDELARGEREEKPHLVPRPRRR